MFLGSGNAEALECHSAKIKVGSKLKLVLLAKREIEWRIGNINDVKESEASIRNQKFDFTVEENAELPKLKWRVHLQPGAAYWLHYNDVDVGCSIVEGAEKLTEGTIFYKIDMEVHGNFDGDDDDGNGNNVNNEPCLFSTEEAERELGNGGMPDLWRRLRKADDYIYFDLYQSPYHAHSLMLPGGMEDGSIMFRFTFQFFTKRLVNEFEQEAHSEMEENWLSHLQTRAEADEASVDGKRTDIKIVSSDGKTVKFHKQILVARSPVFEGMFRSDMRESRSCVVRLEDLSSVAIGFIHHFLYDGKMQPSLDKIRNGGNENLKELEQWIYVAPKYQFEDLLKFFDRMLGIVYNEGNAMELLKLGNRFLLKAGREDVKAFIQKRPHLLNDF